MNMLRLTNPTRELVEGLQTQPYVELSIDARSVELYERCPNCLQIPPAGAYCICDWMREPGSRFIVSGGEVFELDGRDPTVSDEGEEGLPF